MLNMGKIQVVTAKVATDVDIAQLRKVLATLLLNILEQSIQYKDERNNPLSDYDYAAYIRLTPETYEEETPNS
jgi:hypothetical protein